jgi:transcriptional regulator with XRE-family HTH domain
MASVTPFGLMIRRLRLERHEKLGDMANALGVSSAYLSAIEHGAKPINDSFVKKVFLYFDNEFVTLEEWKRLAGDSQPQMKLDLRANRQLKLAFGRSIDSLTEDAKQHLLDILDDHTCGS